MSRKRRITIFAFLCMACFLIVCSAQLAACDNGVSSKHEHEFAVDESSWEWSDDHSECMGREVCTAGDGAYNILYAVVTKEEIGSCTEATYTLYTAVYDGKEVATYKSDPTGWAPGHDLTATWEWNVTDTSVSAKLTVVCSRCGLEEVYDDVEVKDNGDGTYTASTHATGGIYTSTYPETQGA